jgi:hypothetical protein
MKKWEIENNKLPRELKRPRPKKPEDGGKVMTRLLLIFKIKWLPYILLINTDHII